MAYLYIASFILGATIASFMYAWVLRTRAKQSIASGRSMCPQCHHELAWYELLPILSYVVLKGRCRYCKAKIPLQHLVAEVLLGLIFVLLLYYFGPSTTMQWLQYGLWLAMSSFLFAAFYYDIYWLELPDKFTLPALMCGVGIIATNAVMFGFSSITGSLIATVVFVAVYFALWYFSRGKLLGDGDLRLAAIMALSLNVAQLCVAIFFAYFIGAICGVVLILLYKKSRKSQIAFGPFLIAGLYIGLFFGNAIAQWYLGFI